MREILFRGKRIDNGRFVIGFYLQHRNAAHYIVDVRYGGYEDIEGGFFVPRWYAVDPETVGQYIGLTDKNGKKIFEGDIVKGLFLFGLHALGVVVFKDGTFGLKWNRGEVEEFNAFTSICNVTYEVMGNIHDNPELLKGGTP